MSPSGIPLARSSIGPLSVRANGRLCPAFAKRSTPVAGSSTPYRHVTNIFGGMSGQRSSFTRSSTSPGATMRCAEARRTLRVAAITIAAGTPLSVTSPTTRPTLPSGSSMKS